MSILRMGAFGTLAFAAASLLSTAAFAVSCSATIAGKLTSSSGCYIGSTNNDQGPAPLQVNDDNMFGENTWVEFKPEVSVDAKSGTWNLGSDFFDLYEKAIVVLKGGNGVTISPQEYVGYLILEADGTSGDWLTPFINTNNKKGTDVSHVGYYGIACAAGGCGDGGPDPAPGETPIPGAAFLMGSVLAGGVGVRFLRRRRNKTA